MTRRSGRNPDPVRVVAAQLSGTAERCVTGRRLTGDQALVEFGACLAPLATAARQQALDYAAARYVGDPSDAATAMAELLARAGADLVQARTIKRGRGESFVIR